MAVSRKDRQMNPRMFATRTEQFFRHKAKVLVARRKKNKMARQSRKKARCK